MLLFDLMFFHKWFVLKKPRALCCFAKSFLSNDIPILVYYCSAEALDSHLSLIQRDHEQRSQIEERRIKDDAALEEAKKREKALHEARVYQAKLEAEVSIGKCFFACC